VVDREHLKHYEESILASCFYGGHVEVVANLFPEHFSLATNRLIFKAICALDQDSKPIEAVSVAGWLSERGLKKAASSVAKILDVPVPTDLDYYIGVLKSFSLRSSIQAAIKRIDKKCKDPECETTDVVSAFQDELQKIIEGNSGVSTGKSYSELCEEALDHWDKLSTQAQTAGEPTGFQALDKVIGGLYPGDLVILAARPGMGKTTLALNICDHVSKNGSWVYFLSLEMTRHDLIAKHTAKLAQINSSKFRFGGFNKSEWQRITDAMEDLYQRPILIDDAVDDDWLTITRKIRYYAHKYQLKLVIVDYLQLIRGDWRVQRNEMIGRISRSLKLVAKECGINLILLSQLNRKVEAREDKRPMLSDLRDSGSIEQDADIVLFLYRDSYYNLDAEEPQLTELFVAKHRHGDDRKVLPLRFIDWRATFEDWEV